MNLPIAATASTAPQLAVAYLRARDPARISPQRDRCQQAADHLGAQLATEYVDMSDSTHAQRPGLDQLLARLHEGPAVRYVLVAGLDRLSRSIRTFLDFSDALIETEVSLVDAHHGTVIDPPMLRLHAAVFGHLAAPAPPAHRTRTSRRSSDA